jgi:GTP-binding protein HflX
VALVGYTNAGKTTLFNRLTRAHAVASDALFVTLDPLVRQVELSEGRSFCSRTRSGSSTAPHALVAAFRATLEEVAEAELVLHVIDASSPEMERHVAAVRRVLEEVGAADVPLVEVLNKMDAVPADGRAPLEQAEGRVAISARTGEASRHCATSSPRG